MNFVELCSFDNYVRANIVLGMLREEGIDCHLKDELTITIDPFLSPMLGGIKIMVNEWHLKRAQELISERDDRAGGAHSD